MCPILGVCALGGICPGGKCPGGKCPGGYMSGGLCPGHTCPFFFVLSPIWLYHFIELYMSISSQSLQQGSFQPQTADVEASRVHPQLAKEFEEKYLPQVMEVVKQIESTDDYGKEKNIELFLWDFGGQVGDFLYASSISVIFQ